MALKLPKMFYYSFHIHFFHYLKEFSLFVCCADVVVDDDGGGGGVVVLC